MFNAFSGFLSGSITKVHDSIAPADDTSSFTLADIEGFPELEFLRQRIGAEPCTQECAVDFWQMKIPPLPIHCKHCVCPRSRLKSGVGDNYASFRGRPRRFAPGSDALNVCGCKGWP